MARNDYSSGYENVLACYPTLSPSEEKRLFLLYCNNGSKEVRQMIINSNLKLVINIALKYSKFCNDLFTFQDIVEYGTMGLIKAVDRFDVSRNFKFSTYATNWIKREILCGLDLRNCDIPQASKFYYTKKLYFECLDHFICLNGRYPSNDELSQVTGMSLDEIDFINRNLDLPVSLDSPLFDDSDVSMFDCISDNSCSIEECFENRDLRYIILNLLDSMNISDRAKEMFILRFGLDNNGCRTLKYIAGKYGISHQGVYTSNNNVINKIKSKYRYLFEGYVGNGKIKSKNG